MSAAPIKRGRKKAAAAPVEVEQAAPIAPPRPNRASMSDLWEMRLAQMEKRALTAESEVARLTKLYALEKLDKKGIVLALEKRQADAQRLVDIAETKILAAKRRIESTIGRSLNNVAIDPDTGEVVDPTQE